MLDIRYPGKAATPVLEHEIELKIAFYVFKCQYMHITTKLWLHQVTSQDLLKEELRERMFVPEGFEKLAYTGRSRGSSTWLLICIYIKSPKKWALMSVEGAGAGGQMDL